MLNSQNSLGTVTINYVQGIIGTLFGVPNLQEYCTYWSAAECSAGLIQSITLPDGTSYNFKYDCDPAYGSFCNGASPPAGQPGYSGFYGLLTGVTLPTGGAINFTYSNFKDANGNVNRWVSTRTSGGGQWTYTPATGCGTGCQTVTVTRPTGDQTVYTYTLNQGDGAWNTNVMAYNGPATGTPLETVQNTFESFPAGNPAFAFTHLNNTTTTVPGPGGNLVKQIAYTYDTFTYSSYSCGSCTGTTGKLLTKSEYGFGIGAVGPLIRKTVFSYLDDANPAYKSANIIDRVTDMQIQDAAGNIQAETKVTYDSTPLTSVTGVTGHDDTFYGTGNNVRGNPTVIQNWVSGTTFLSKTLTYDTTGNLVQMQDSAGNQTTFSYSDQFFNDSSPAQNPPQSFAPTTPTNAYLTKITSPIIGDSFFGYYFGTGKRAFAKDQNGADVYQHYLDSLDRLTHVYSPLTNGSRAWALTSYTSSTVTDAYAGINDTQPSTSCTSCVHVQSDIDSLGRTVRAAMLSDPEGVTYVDSTYDTSGRIQNVTNPYRSTSDATYGVESPTYDALGRIVKTTHADNNSAQRFFGPDVTAAGGLANQVCPTSTCGLGYPVLAVDESGRKRQVWTDALGRPFEVDDASEGASATASVTISGALNVAFGSGGSGTGLSSNWTVNNGTFASSSNGLAGTSTNAQRAVAFYNGAFSNDQFAQMTMSYLPAVSDGLGPAVRVQPGGGILGGNYYAFYVSLGPAKAWLFKSVNGTLTVLNSLAGQSVNVGDTLRLEVVGTALTAKINGAVVLTATDSDISSGNPGIQTHPNGPTSQAGTSFIAGNLPEVADSFTSVDSGTVSLNVGGFVATACFGSSINAACVGRTINNSAVQVTTALIQTLNGSGSPASAGVSGSTTINLTWKTPGPFTPTVGVLTTTHDNPTVFPNPSFTSQGTSFAGGSAGTLTNASATLYSYSVLDNLMTVTQGTQTRSYSYDHLSRVTSETAPEYGSENLYYTTTSGSLCSGDASAVCRSSDARGTISTYAYDALNRLTSVTYSESTPAATYFYDQTSYNGLSIANGKGRRTGMSDGSGTAAWSYDTSGRITMERRTIAGVTKTISYSYNPDGSPASITYPSGRRVTYVMGNAGRPISATDADGTLYATGARYSPPGGISSVVYGNVGGFGGVTESHGYNNRVEYTGTQVSSSNGTALNLTLGYGASGNNGSVVSIANNLDPGRTQSFIYDALNRLASATSNASSGADCFGQTFGIDSLANLTSMSITSCAPGQLNASVNGNNQLVGFSYDSAGNMTGDGTYAYTFDAENRITSAAGVNYVYDGDGLRVKKSSGTIYWRSPAGATLAESDLNGNITNEYISLFGSATVHRDASGNAFYHFTDHLGSTRTITQSNGAVCYDADFTPFGQEMAHTNTCAQNYKFTGYERDGETGLDYAFARYYNPRLGRFMSADPVGGSANNPQSWNAYSYVQNDPMNSTDPLGADPIDLILVYNSLSGSIYGWGFGSFGSSSIGGGSFGFGGPGPGLSGSFGWCPVSNGFCTPSQALAQLLGMQHQAQLDMAQMSNTCAAIINGACLKQYAGGGSGPIGGVYCGGAAPTVSGGCPASSSSSSGGYASVGEMASFLGQEVLGVWDVTGGAAYSVVRHPIDTGAGLLRLGLFVSDPYGNWDTGIAIAESVDAYWGRLSSGNPRAIGQLVGTAASVAYSAENVRIGPYPSGGGGINLRNAPTRGSRFAADWGGAWKGGSGFHIDIWIKRLSFPKIWEPVSGPGSNWFLRHHWQPWR